VVEKLEAGASVADVGCGHGASTIIMAEAFPASSFLGFDTHRGGIERARQAAAEAGVAERVRFEIARADALPVGGYDLVCLFDAFHDLGDPGAAARHLRETLASDGTLMLVEPQAGDRPEDNLNPVGRIFYAGSALICVPHAIADCNGQSPALGAQAGEATLRTVLEQAGFRAIRRAAETPFNLVLEARP
jgi:SAM-dependent methyltransferase